MKPEQLSGFEKKEEARLFRDDKTRSTEVKSVLLKRCGVRLKTNPMRNVPPKANARPTYLSSISAVLVMVMVMLMLMLMGVSTEMVYVCI